MKSNVCLPLVYILTFKMTKISLVFVHNILTRRIILYDLNAEKVYIIVIVSLPCYSKKYERYSASK